MKNILILRSRISVGGPGRQIEVTIDQMVEHGQKVIVAAGGGDLLPNIKGKGIKCYVIEDLQVSNRKPTKYLSIINKIRKIIKHENVDVILGFETASAMLAYIAVRLDKKEITVNSYILGAGKEWFKRIVPFTMICCSNAQREELIKHFHVNKNRLKVCWPSTIDTVGIEKQLKMNSSIRKELDLTDKDILIGSVMMGMKGDTEYIDYVLPVLKKYENVRLLFVGTTEKYMMYKKQLKEAGFINRAFFVGQRDDVINIMAEIDILSHLIGDGNETFGMVLTEAMYMRTPIVATKKGGINDIVDEGINGFLIKNGDRNSYLEYISKLVESKELRQQMGNMARNKVIKYFTTEAYYQKLKEIMKID